MDTPGIGVGPDAGGNHDAGEPRTGHDVARPGDHHCAALGQIVLEFIRFMVLPDNRLLVVLVSGGGRTRDKLLHLERTFLQAELDETAQYLNTENRGWTLNAIRVNLQTTLARDRKRYDKLRTDALLLCDPALLGGDERTQVYVAGAAQIATAADCADERELGELLGAIEQRQRPVTLLTDCIESPEPVHVQIGVKEIGGAGEHLALISAPYVYDEHSQGSLGVE